jgi:hypothetical protein
MLAVSWWVAGVVLRRRPLPLGRARWVMGGVAFAVLMLAEALLALALGETPATYIEGLRRPAGLLGLAGQIGFALIPAIRK